MRYFRCEQVDMTQMAAFRGKYARLLEMERQAARREKVWRRLGMAVFITVTAFCLVGGEILVWSLPERDLLLLQILQTVLQGILSVAVLFLSFVLGALASTPLFTRGERNRKAEKQAVLAAACGALREGYGLTEPCLVTKCYRCDDKRFTDHDVCLFFVEEELRMTTNLQGGFIRLQKDLGCYAFAPEELRLRVVPWKNATAVELTGDDFTCLLGARAKGFLEKNGNTMIHKETDR